jgi:hypothetical protein
VHWLGCRGTQENRWSIKNPRSQVFLKEKKTKTHTKQLSHPGFFFKKQKDEEDKNKYM